jgi:hypothetical protein
MVINFEADYLLNPWSYRNTGSHCFIISDFQQFVLLAKIETTSGYGDKNARKAHKYILFQIVLD